MSCHGRIYGLGSRDKGPWATGHKELEGASHQTSRITQLIIQATTTVRIKIIMAWWCWTTTTSNHKWNIKPMAFLRCKGCSTKYSFQQPRNNRSHGTNRNPSKITTFLFYQHSHVGNFVFCFCMLKVLSFVSNVVWFTRCRCTSKCLSL